MTENESPKSESSANVTSGGGSSSSTGTEVARWADVAMYRSEPLKAAEGPRAVLLAGPSDPLGLIAAQAKTYVGEFVNDLAEVTDDERRHYLVEIQKTALAMPLEAVELNFSIWNVTRAFTHQMVRQRTAAYAQESLRFSVIEDGFTDRVALPPELMGAKSLLEWDREATAEVRGSGRTFITDQDEDTEIDAVMDSLIERYGTDQDKQRVVWERAVIHTERAYKYLVNNGLPAESARGLLPHNITTRIKYNTNLRALLEHIGLRTCTQAQFEWRGVAAALAQALREYGQHQKYRVVEDDDQGGWEDVRSSAWQYNAIADLFQPICYRAGKCTMKASFDRACSIRDRVELNAAINRPSSEWHLERNVDGNFVGDKIKPIFPAEWLLNPAAAR